MRRAVQAYGYGRPEGRRGDGGANGGRSGCGACGAAMGPGVLPQAGGVRLTHTAAEG